MDKYHPLADNPRLGLTAEANLIRAWLFAFLYICGVICRRAATLLFHAGAGFLKLADLRKAIQQEWEEFNRQEQEITLMPWESSFYLKFLKSEDHILIVGCGAGRDLLALLELGFRVDGLDFLPNATAIAREAIQKQGETAKIYTGSIETVALPSRFDVFIFSWFCYGYIPHSQTRIQILKKVRANLNPQGRILISYVPRKGTSESAIQVTRIVARLTRSDWHPENGDRIRIAAPGRHLADYTHEFQPVEVEAEARKAGLDVSFHQTTSVGLVVLTTSSPQART